MSQVDFNGESVTRSQWSMVAWKWLQLSSMTQLQIQETRNTQNTHHREYPYRPYPIRANTWGKHISDRERESFDFSLWQFSIRCVARYSPLTSCINFTICRKRPGHPSTYPGLRAYSFYREDAWIVHTYFYKQLPASAPYFGSSACIARMPESVSRRRLVSAVHGRQCRSHIAAAPLASLQVVIRNSHDVSKLIENKRQTVRQRKRDRSERSD